MSVLGRLRRFVRHPATLGSAGILALVGLEKGGLLWALLVTFWANAGSAFGTASIGLFLGDQLGFPEWVIQAAAVIAVVAGLMAVAKFLLSFQDDVEERTQ